MRFLRAGMVCSVVWVAGCVVDAEPSGPQDAVGGGQEALVVSCGRAAQVTQTTRARERAFWNIACRNARGMKVCTYGTEVRTTTLAEACAAFAASTRASLIAANEANALCACQYRTQNETPSSCGSSRCALTTSYGTCLLEPNSRFDIVVHGEGSASWAADGVWYGVVCEADTEAQASRIDTVRCGADPLVSPLPSPPASPLPPGNTT